jgi:hypothetical protein
MASREGGEKKLNTIHNHSGKVQPPFLPLEIQHTIIIFITMKEILT